MSTAVARRRADLVRGVAVDGGRVDVVRAVLAVSTAAQRHDADRQRHHDDGPAADHAGHELDAEDRPRSRGPPDLGRCDGEVPRGGRGGGRRRRGTERRRGERDE